MAKGDGKLSVALKDGIREDEPKSRAHSVGRFSLYFAILKGRFGRLMLVNALVLLSALPLIAIVMYRYLVLGALEMTGPYGAGLGVGYPMLPQIPGLMEDSILKSDLFFFALLIPAAAILAISLSGGMYLCCNLVKTEGVYHFSDFKRGIKQTYFPVLSGVLIFMFMLFFVQTVKNVADWQMAIGSPAWIGILSKVIGYIFLSFVLMVGLWMISIGIGYKLNIFKTIKNAVILAVGTFPQTLFFAAISAAPVILLLFGKGFWFVIALVFFSLIGFSFSMLIWVSYSQWVFDKYLTPEKEEVKSKSNKSAKEEERPLTREELVRIATAYERSVLISRPIEPLEKGENPYELPEFYTRADILKLGERRDALSKEAERYAGEHLSESRYAEFNRKWEEREEALPDTRKKPPKRPKMLKR